MNPGDRVRAVNRMDGGEMEATITGPALVPRGSETGERVYPVLFENGDRGYVPVADL